MYEEQETGRRVRIHPPINRKPRGKEEEEEEEEEGGEDLLG